MLQDKSGAARDFLASETHGYILLPNVVLGRVLDFQGVPPRRLHGEAPISTNIRGFGSALARVC